VSSDQEKDLCPHGVDWNEKDSYCHQCVLALWDAVVAVYPEPRVPKAEED
jgi:hypothetical protein